MKKEELTFSEADQEKMTPEEMLNSIKVLAEGKKMHAEAKKLKAEAEKIKAEIKRLKIETGLLPRKNSLMDKAFTMMILSGVMTSTFENGESFTIQRLFSDEELYEYKAKMMEILKSMEP